MIDQEAGYSASELLPYDVVQVRDLLVYFVIRGF